MKRWLIMPLLMGIACSVSGANMESNAISSINQVKQITKDIYLLPG